MWMQNCNLRPKGGDKKHFDYDSERIEKGYEMYLAGDSLDRITSKLGGNHSTWKNHIQRHIDHLKSIGQYEPVMVRAGMPAVKLETLLEEYESGMSATELGEKYGVKPIVIGKKLTIARKELLG